MKSISQVFIDHPRLAWVISIVIALCGTICLFRTPVAEYPNITPVTITVSTTYTGASAEVVNESVGMVIEDQINAVDDIWYYKSNANAKGAYNCYCVFRPGTPSNIALVNVQNAVKRAEPKLPTEVTQSGIVVRKSPEDRMVMYMFMTDGREMDLMELSNFVEKQVADDLARMDGVALVSSGGRTYAMRIWLDPVRLAGLNVSIAEIKDAIESQNVQAAAGTVGGEYANKYLSFKLNVKGRLKTKEEFENIVIRSNPQTGAQVLVKDVARDVLDEHLRAGLRVRADDDVLELLLRLEAALHVQLEGEVLVRVLAADRAGGGLHVLALDRVLDLGDGDVEAGEPHGVEPNAHRIGAAAGGNEGDAVHARKVVRHLLLDEVRELHEVHLAPVGHEHVHDHAVLGALAHDNAALRDLRGELRLGALDSVLHVDEGNIGGRAGAEDAVAVVGALRVRVRLVVPDVVHGVDLVLDHHAHGLVDDLGARARVRRRHGDRHGGDVRVLGDRRAEEADCAAERDDDRYDPREARVVDEDLGDGLHGAGVTFMPLRTLCPPSATIFSPTFRPFSTNCQSPWMLPRAM